MIFLPLLFPVYIRSRSILTESDKREAALQQQVAQVQQAATPAEQARADFEDRFAAQTQQLTEVQLKGNSQQTHRMGETAMSDIGGPRLATEEKQMFAGQTQMLTEVQLKRNRQHRHKIQRTGMRKIDGQSLMTSVMSEAMTLYVLSQDMDFAQLGEKLKILNVVNQENFPNKKELQAADVVLVEEKTLPVIAAASLVTATILKPQ